MSSRQVPLTHPSARYTTQHKCNSNATHHTDDLKKRKIFTCSFIQQKHTHFTSIHVHAHTHTHTLQCMYSFMMSMGVLNGDSEMDFYRFLRARILRLVPAIDNEDSVEELSQDVSKSRVGNGISHCIHRIHTNYADYLLSWVGIVCVFVCLFVCVSEQVMIFTRCAKSDSPAEVLMTLPSLTACFRARGLRLEQADFLARTVFSTFPSELHDRGITFGQYRVSALFLKKMNIVIVMVVINRSET